MSKFQKRHYNAVADVINTRITELRLMSQQTMADPVRVTIQQRLLECNKIMDEFTLMFSKDNEYFYRSMFEAKCQRFND